MGSWGPGAAGLKAKANKVACEKRDRLSLAPEVTVNEVRVAPDGSYAKIFWGTLGPPAAAAEAIEKAKPYLRRCLASELHTRRVPELDFRLDDTLARAQRVESVIRELEQERAAKQKEEPA